MDAVVLAFTPRAQDPKILLKGLLVQLENALFSTRYASYAPTVDRVVAQQGDARAVVHEAQHIVSALYQCRDALFSLVPDLHELNNQDVLDHSLIAEMRTKTRARIEAYEDALDDCACFINAYAPEYLLQA